MADPEPNKIFPILHRRRTIVDTNAGRPKSANFLEAKRG
jgi:hypothetical protein